MHFDQNLPIHPEIIHSSFSILLRVILAIPQPPFGMKICSDICSRTLSVTISEHFSKSIQCTVAQ